MSQVEKQSQKLGVSKKLLLMANVSLDKFRSPDSGLRT